MHKLQCIINNKSIIDFILKNDYYTYIFVYILTFSEKFCFSEYEIKNGGDRCLGQEFSKSLSLKFKICKTEMDTSYSYN